MRRRNILLIVVTVVVLAAALTVWLWPAGDVDATTSDAPPASLGSDVPFAFDEPAWTRSLPAGAEVVVDGPYAVVRERTGVRVYELATGAERWHYLDNGLVVTHLAAWHGNLTVLSEHEVRLFDLDTGELMSAVPVAGGDRTAMPVNENNFLVLSNGKDAYRYYSNDGQELWAVHPEACATSTQAYYSTTDLVFASSCPDRTVLNRLNRRTGDVFKSADLPNLVPSSTSNPPRAVLLPEDAPILLTTGDSAVAAVDVLTLTAEPARPYPATAELTSVRSGWCAYTTAPEPVVTCQEHRTGAVIEQPYHLDPGVGSEPVVRIFAVDTPDILVAGITGTTVTVGYVGDHPTEVMSGVQEPEVVYYGQGALVVTTKDTLTVYTSAFS